LEHYIGGVAGSKPTWWLSMIFLVTGGCGFIGSNLVERLVNDGHRVIVLDDLSTGTIKNIEGLDVRLITSCHQVWDIPKVDGIFHLGMPPSTQFYRRNPRLVGKTIDEATTLLEYAKEKQVKIVFASSSSLYNKCPTPYREDMPIYATDYYTECKYAIERLGNVFNQFYGVKFVSLRLFSVYGRKEKHKGQFANVVSQFLWSMQRGEPPIIYGDGSQTRDFINVDDVVEAFILAMQKDFEYEVFNVGTGKAYSFNEIVRLLNKHLGTDIKPIYKPNPIKNYVYHTLADMSKTERLLGFKPKISLKQGIKTIINEGVENDLS
jgi:UDP-glucose 4-epimerase